MRLKMWIGNNLDGVREGLVIATSKKSACAVIGTSSRRDFDDYWTEQSAVDPSLEPEVLYTRRFTDRSATWSRGRCS